ALTAPRIGGIDDTEKSVAGKERWQERRRREGAVARRLSSEKERQRAEL
ncbi:hypothetical protein Tco_1541442, partial [Tanacetum coccineum]